MDLHHHQQQHYYLNVSPDPGGDGGGGGGGGGGGERDRLAQWSHVETKEFLAVRAELDQSFMETKRNKHLWAAVSARMADKGFHRTPEQCKCKWKNLFTRYKGTEAMEGGTTSRQFPFHDDMRVIFSQRMERLLSFDEAKPGVQTWLEGEATIDAACGEEQEARKKRKTAGASSSRARVEDVESTLREFMRWQTQLHAQRLQAAEAREAERREKEMEWRRAMEALAIERAAMERRWRAAEEEQRLRQEARAERRDTLVTALLNKLLQKGL